MYQPPGLDRKARNSGAEAPGGVGILARWCDLNMKRKGEEEARF